MKYLIFGAVVLLHAVTGEDIPVNIPCNSDDQCRSPRLPENAYCSDDGTCMCLDENKTPQNCTERDNVVPEGKSATNTNVVTLVGRICKIEQDCSNLENGFCNTARSQCECKSNFIASNDNQRCLQVAESDGSACEEEKQCLMAIANSTCANGRCTCVRDYHFVNGVCWQKVKFGEPCTSSQQCLHVTDAECDKQGVCACPSGKVINPDAMRCLPVAASYQSECQENVQCSQVFGEGSECVDKKCQCKQQRHFNESMKQCVVNRALGDGCAESYECYQGETEDQRKALLCIASRCACAPGYQAAGRLCKSGAAAITSLSAMVLLSTWIFISL